MVRGYYSRPVKNQGFAFIWFCHGEIDQLESDLIPVHRDPISHDFYAKQRDVLPWW